MKVVKVNKDKCFGCGSCVSIAPQNFDFDKDGLSKVINSDITDEAIEACDVCPAFAIEIVNDSSELDEENGLGCNGQCCCSDNCGCGGNCECENK